MPAQPTYHKNIYMNLAPVLGPGVEKSGREDDWCGGAESSNNIILLSVLAGAAFVNKIFQ